MADNIGVKPSTADSAVSVATDVIGDVHYPMYKLVVGEDGEASFVGFDNPINVADKYSDKILDALEELITIQKGMMALMEAAFDDDISGRDNLNGD